MIQWLDERILSITRTLEYSQFIGRAKRASLEEELSQLLTKREQYYEFKRQDREENDRLKRWPEDSDPKE